MQRVFAALSVALLSGFSAAVHADALRVDAHGEAVRVDGALRDWKGAHFATLGDDAGRSLRYALLSDARGLYLGLDVDDDALVHRATVGGAADAVVLTVVDGSGKGARAREVWFYPGESGRSKSQAAISAPGSPPNAPDTRIRIVEGPRDEGHGYVLEAFVPFDVLFGAELWEMGRAALRFEDADPGVRDRVRISSTDGAGPSLPHFLLGDGQHDFIGSLASATGHVGLEPSVDLRSNLLGDARPERIALLDKYIIAYGSGIQEGAGFVYFEVPVANASAIDELSVVDFDGDGHSELVLRLRQQNSLGVRTLYTVLSVHESAIARVFSAEVKKEVGANSLENALELRDVARGGKRLRLALVPAKSAPNSAFDEHPAEDAVPLLTPWGAVRAHTYAFDGSRFAMVDEVPQTPAKSSAITAQPTASKPALAATPGPASMSARAASPVTVAPSHGEVLAHFKRAAKLPGDAEPSRVFVGNLRGHGGDESVYVFGNVLVALGPDIGAGRGYVAYGLPVDPSGLRHVGLADVTGDGNAEIFVRVLQPLAGADEVRRELVLVLRLAADGKFVRALNREVTRRQGAHVVANRVCTKSGALEIDRGTAVGWDAANYPFRDEATGAAEALLLPWKTANPARFVLDGEVLVEAH